LQKNNLKKK